MKRIIAVIAVLVAFNTSTFAADLPVKAAGTPAAPLFNWTGFYVGINGGRAWGRIYQTDPLKLHDGLVGGTIGYNWQAGNWVVGIEGDWDWFDAKARQQDSCLSVCTTKFDRFGTARARLGYANGQSLMYLTGGIAFTRAHIFSGNGALNGPWDTTTGWTIGAGYEGALANNWSWKIEYLYADFDKHFADAGSGLLVSDAHFNVVRVGLNYKFGDWGKAPVVAKY